MLDTIEKKLATLKVAMIMNMLAIVACGVHPTVSLGVVIVLLAAQAILIYFHFNMSKTYFDDTCEAEVYLVGGAVRDELMGNEPRDSDYVICGMTAEAMREEGWGEPVGKFPVWIDDEGNEWALARTEKSTGPGYNDFEVDFNPTISIEEDLYRRDFTVNAIAYGVSGPFSDTYIDPYGGMEDIEKKILKPVNPESFRDDPVRIFRAARFAARLEFTMHDDIFEQTKRCIENGGLEAMTKERVWLEFEKAIADDVLLEFAENLRSLGVEAHFGWSLDITAACKAQKAGLPDSAVFAALFIEQSTFNKLCDVAKVPLVYKNAAKDLHKFMGYTCAFPVQVAIVDAFKFTHDRTQQGRASRLFYTWAAITGCWTDEQIEAFHDAYYSVERDPALEGKDIEWDMRDRQIEEVSKVFRDLFMK